MKKFFFFSTMILMSAGSIAQAPKIPPDCEHTTSLSSASYISNVKLGTINNTSTTSPDDYGHYTALSTNVAISNSYTINVTSSGISSHTTGYTANWKVYIDYNKNGIPTEAGELVASGSAPAGSSASFTFTPPAATFNGPTILHIEMTQFKPAPKANPCTDYYDEGEKEDYTVNITGGFCYSHGLHTTYEYINKIVFGSINNLSGNNNGYGNYTSQTTNLTAGFTYNFAIYPGYANALRHEYVRVYIDYNKDKIFGNTSPFVSEIIATMDGFGFMSKQIQIPFTVPDGKTRLRIVMTSSGSVTDPCAVFSYGEVEDYTVNILPPVLSPGIQSNKEVVSGNKTASVMVAPNPAKASDARVLYTVVKVGKTNIIIADFSGRVVQNIAVGNKAAGSFNLLLNNIRGLTAGTYLITMKQDDKVVAQSKFIVRE